MVTLEILSNVRCRAIGLSKDVRKHLDASLAEAQKGSEWAPNHRRFGGVWDGKKHHFYCSPTKTSEGTFPKGLLERVQALLTKQDVKHRVKDLRKKLLPPIDVSKLSPDALKGVSMTGKYSYQFDAVKEALRKQTGILYMATNAGKSEIASAMIKAMDKLTVLFVVPKAILLKQTRERIAERLGTVPETIGVIGGGRFEPKEITLAIINSITPAKSAKSQRSKRKNEILREYLRTVDAVFLDEGHHAKATTWFRLMGALVNAQFRYLMSGTPFNGDNDLMVEAATGPIIYEIRNDALITLGVSAKPKVRVLNVDEPDLELEDDQTWHGVYSAGITNNDYRNQLIAKTANEYASANKAVLILIRHLQQGSNILTNVKAPCEFVHGKMFDSERDKLVAWFANHKNGRVLIASSIFDEGVDVPHVNAMIIGDGGESLRSVLQKVGRSIRRKKEGENVVDVVDFADCTHRWLAKHALERFDIYSSEGFEIVEENPKEKQYEQKRNDSQDSSTIIPPLSWKDDVGSCVSWSSSDYSRPIAPTTVISATQFSEGSAIVLWRWRSAA